MPALPPRDIYVALLYNTNSFLGLSSNTRKVDVRVYVLFSIFNLLIGVVAIWPTGTITQWIWFQSPLLSKGDLFKEELRLVFAVIVRSPIDRELLTRAYILPISELMWKSLHTPRCRFSSVCNSLISNGSSAGILKDLSFSFIRGDISWWRRVNRMAPSGVSPRACFLPSLFPSFSFCVSFSSSSSSSISVCKFLYLYGLISSSSCISWLAIFSNANTSSGL